MALAAVVVAIAAAAALAFILHENTDSSGPPAGSAESPTHTEKSPTNSGLVWRGDFETGDFSQWEGVDQHTPGRASVVTSPHRQGRYAGRFEVREGEFIGSDAPTRNRTEAYVSPLANRHKPKEGDDWWYRWWFYLPSKTPIPAQGQQAFMIITQWASSAPADSPDFELEGSFEFRDTLHTGQGPGPGYVELLYGDNNSRADGGGEYFWRKAATDVTRNAWHKILFHRKWSSNPNVGFVEIYYDDDLQTLTNHRTRIYARTLKSGYSARMHQGIYRSNVIGGTAVIYFDGLRIGKTRASVDK